MSNKENPEDSTDQTVNLVGLGNIGEIIKISKISEFDVWSNSDGQFKATMAVKKFADEENIPYGFDAHQIRLSASCPKHAIKSFKILLNDEIK